MGARGTEERTSADAEGRPPIPADDAEDRRRAALAALPFLALGLGNVVLVVGWGLDPLWAFALLPPILFMCALAWIAFKTGFVGDRA